MKTEEKNKVVAALANHPKNPKERYKSLVESLLELKEATPAQKRFFNASGYSPGNLASLEYDLKKLCNITEREVKKAMASTKEEIQAETNTTELPEELKTKLQELDVENADYNKELRPLAKEVAEVVGAEPVSKKKVHLIDFLNPYIEKGPTTEELVDLVKTSFEKAPDEVKRDIKLRDEFPFLASEDCPDEFKILVADKLTAFHNYKDGREELKQAVENGLSNEEIFEIAKKTVENFELNLDIYDELNYYKEHGEILGKHPIFADKMLKESVENMSTVELGKRQKNLRTYVSRDEKKLAKMEEGEDKQKFAEKLQDWKDELKLVDARLEKIS